MDDVAFYLYFAEPAQAERATGELRSQGLQTEARRGADGESWLALGRGPVKDEDELDAWEERLSELADRLGGEYDGYDR